jgi:hypothetical protein
MDARDTRPAARRIVVEDEDLEWYRMMVELADPEEYELVPCRGPVLEPGGCPVLEGGRCPKIEWADTIVHTLDPREPANRAILATLKNDWHEMPLPACPGGPTTHLLDRRR